MNPPITVWAKRVLTNAHKWKSMDETIFMIHGLMVLSLFYVLMEAESKIWWFLYINQGLLLDYYWMDLS